MDIMAHVGTLMVGVDAKIWDVGHLFIITTYVGFFSVVSGGSFCVLVSAAAAFCDYCPGLLLGSFRGSFC